MNVHQSIETKYVGPTNHRESRVIATTPGKHRRVHHSDYALGIEGNHFAAAEALRAELEWPSIKAGASTKAGYAWCTSILEQAQ